MDADPIEIGVLGRLIEKQRTTPDVYAAKQATTWKLASAA